MMIFTNKHFNKQLYQHHQSDTFSQNKYTTKQNVSHILNNQETFNLNKTVLNQSVYHTLNNEETFNFNKTSQNLNVVHKTVPVFIQQDLYFYFVKNI